MRIYIEQVSCSKLPAIKGQHKFKIVRSSRLFIFACSCWKNTLKNMQLFFLQHAEAPEAPGVQRLALWQEEGVVGSK